MGGAVFQHKGPAVEFACWCWSGRQDGKISGEMLARRNAIALRWPGFAAKSPRNRWILHDAIYLLPGVLSSACDLCANGKFPVRPDKVTGVAVRKALEIVLMLWLGFPERSNGGDFGDDLPGPQS